ncbi:MAG TPA: hypothetical protein VMZ27_11305 [Candidatus Saccharimonadales bacterium]|nr:hypothetical protein [Candidatus Saccharimonadales bacterium]
MDAIYNEQMLRLLRPLRDSELARKILQRYWKDRVAFVWTVQQVHMAANERDLAFTKEEARSILRDLYEHTDQFQSLNWFRLLQFIDESCFGRKLTNAELDRFLETNLIVVAKPKRSRPSRA